jgi:hypothetical protein
MSALDPASLDTLSDGEAVALLFELTGRGEGARDKLVQLDSVVYGRLRETYGADRPPGAGITA